MLPYSIAGYFLGTKVNFRGLLKLVDFRIEVQMTTSLQ